jgi:serine/threonine-protein kinase
MSPIHSSLDAQVLPEPGDVVAGKYRIEKIAGEGGMGVVFSAHHLVLDRRVALKVLVVDAARRDEFIERFVREAQAAARLDSEHVVRVMDAGSLDNDMPFFVMEHLEGRDLAQKLLDEGPLAFSLLADYGLQVLAALSQAHAAGIVHRDLKPANLFLADVEDGRQIIKILDFGISKHESERAQWKQLTGQGILGTPAYMSPEQLRSSRNVDEGADIWSLGVALYELATGVLPFDGDGPGELFAAILETTAVPARTYRPDLPEAFEAVLSCCLERDRDARFADVRAMAEALAPLGSGKWSHLLDHIERSLACSKRFVAATEVALVAAAVAATSGAAPSASSLSVVCVDVNVAARSRASMMPTVPAPLPVIKARPSRRTRIAFFTALFAGPLVAVSLLAPPGARSTGSAAVSQPVSLVVPELTRPPPPPAPPVALPMEAPAVEVAPAVTTAPAPTTRPSPPLKAAVIAPRKTKGRPAFLKSRE